MTMPFERGFPFFQEVEIELSVYGIDAFLDFDGAIMVRELDDQIGFLVVVTPIAIPKWLLEVRIGWNQSKHTLTAPCGFR